MDGAPQVCPQCGGTTFRKSDSKSHNAVDAASALTKVCMDCGLDLDSSVAKLLPVFRTWLDEEFSEE